MVLIVLAIIIMLLSVAAHQWVAALGWGMVALLRARVIIEGMDRPRG